MARLYEPVDEQTVAKMPVANMRKEYIKIASQYSKFANAELTWCPKCGEAMSVNTAFYTDSNYKLGYFPICKRCILAMVEQRENKNDTPNETPESVQKVLQMMDLPYIDSFYRDCVKGAQEGLKEKNRKSPFLTYLTALKSLPNWRGLRWNSSEFGNEIENEENTKIVQKTLKEAKKRFGNGSYSESQYMFLENEYKDWISRYECNTKGQEEVFESLSILKLRKQEAMKNEKPIKDIKEIDNLIQSWLDTGNLKPKQNTMDALSDAQTLGTLLQKYEETRPLPEIDPELKDCDKIGYYIDSLYRGHSCKMLGIKNTFSHLYEKFMEKYTVSRPEYSEETDSEILFEKIFGKVEDE